MSLRYHLSSVITLSRNIQVLSLSGCLPGLDSGSIDNIDVYVEACECTAWLCVHIDSVAVGHWLELFRVRFPVATSQCFLSYKLTSKFPHLKAYLVQSQFLSNTTKHVHPTCRLSLYLCFTWCHIDWLHLETCGVRPVYASCAGALPFVAEWLFVVSLLFNINEECILH